MISDVATRLLPSERWIALVLAAAVLRAPWARFVAADLLADCLYAIRPADVHRTLWAAVTFALEAIA